MPCEGELNPGPPTAPILPPACGLLGGAWLCGGRGQDGGPPWCRDPAHSRGLPSTSWRLLGFLAGPGGRGAGLEGEGWGGAGACPARWVPGRLQPQREARAEQGWAEDGAWAGGHCSWKTQARRRGCRDGGASEGTGAWRKLGKEIQGHHTQAQLLGRFGGSGVRGAWWVGAEGTCMERGGGSGRGGED